MPESRCDHALISLPYLYGPKLEWIQDPRIRFLWLVPITLAEREFKKTHGVEALEQRFEQAQFDHLDVKRAALV